MVSWDKSSSGPSGFLSFTSTQRWLAILGSSGLDLWLGACSARWDKIVLPLVWEMTKPFLGSSLNLRTQQSSSLHHLLNSISGYSCTFFSVNSGEFHGAVFTWNKLQLLCNSWRWQYCGWIKRWKSAALWNNQHENGEYPRLFSISTVQLSYYCSFSAVTTISYWCACMGSFVIWRWHHFMFTPKLFPVYILDEKW